MTEEIKDPEGLLKAYTKAKEDLVELRAENKSLQAQVSATSEDTVNKWKERAIKAEAKLSLEAQGIKEPDRILKYVNLEGVDFDDQDNIKGLDEKLDGIKQDFPELFDTKRRAGRNSADIHADGKPNTTKSTTEAQVDALFGS